VITILGLFSITSGALSDWWTSFLRHVFGWGAYLVAVGLAAAGISLLLSNLGQGPKARWKTIIGLEIIFVAGLALIHLLSFNQDPLRLAESGGGGGLVGWAISSLLIGALGWPFTLLIFLVILGLGLAMAFGVSWASVQTEAKAAIARAISLYSRPAPVTVSAPPPVEKHEEPPAEVVIREPEAPVPAVEPQPEVKPRKEQKPPAPRKRQFQLPSLDLLDTFSPQVFSQEDTRRRARVIEETLASFGVPAKVAEISQGPAVTQFGVEPGYIESTGADGRTRRRKIRVSKITSLANDLSLALAASPIRIEAPVPGRPIVGIEVPNPEISLVSLRGVMESKEFRRLDSKLKIALGQGVAGQPVVADLATMPHLLIAGATGSGKSVCINAITTCLVCNNTPEDLRLVMIDPKMVELSRFKGLPHLLSGVETEVERVVGVLRWVTQEMEERYKKFAEAGARHLEDYNHKKPRPERLPCIVVLIDELADLMLFAPDEIEWLICRIAQMARATGIHLIMATQRPSVDVVTGLIKANFPARISFTVTSQVDSRVILDSAGAESLLGEGDMLYMASDSSKLVRIQGCFVSDEEIKRVVQFWQAEAEEDWPGEEKPPWEEMVEEEEEDELLEEAIEIVKKYERASTSFLQRKLRIGYPRASRIMDQLEERGVVGALKDDGRSREVLVSAPDEVSAEGIEKVD
jgi:S-DNA-T family DNA segregation ATPase FtsK/SpoIIIE